MTFTIGQLVQTPLGTGSVCYQRLAAPEYREAIAVSVKLDGRKHVSGYTGTIFPATEVTPWKGEQHVG